MLPLPPNPCVMAEEQPCSETKSLTLSMEFGASNKLHRNDVIVQAKPYGPAMEQYNNAVPMRKHRLLYNPSLVLSP